MDLNAPTSTSEAVKIPEHVERFFELTEALDEQVRREPQDPIAVTRCRAGLKAYYLTLLPEQQADVQAYIERDIVGETIEDQRGWARRAFTRVLHFPHQLVGAAVEPVARFCGKTTELVGLTLGWTVRGAYQGLKIAWSMAA